MTEQNEQNGSLMNELKKRTRLSLPGTRPSLPGNSSIEKNNFRINFIYTNKTFLQCLST